MTFAINNVTVHTNTSLNVNRRVDSPACIVKVERRELLGARYAKLCRMVRFRRSINEVFNVDESSEFLSASSKRCCSHRHYAATRSRVIVCV